MPGSKKTDIASLTVIVWDRHYNAELLVIDVSMNSGTNIEVDYKSTEWISWRKSITREDIGVLA